MATKKQRRRRQKGRRHEYEFVYVDEEGHEVEVDEPEPKPKKAEARKPTSAGENAPKNAPSAGRAVETPPLGKGGRRGGLFSPFLVIFFYLTPGSHQRTAPFV